MVRKSMLRNGLISFVMSVFLISGFLLAPAGVMPGALGTKKAVAACYTNVYQVVWSYAGVYRDINTGAGWYVEHMGTLRGGDRIHGGHGDHRYEYRHGYGYITNVYYGGSYISWMRSDSLKYIGCY